MLFELLVTLALVLIGLGLVALAWLLHRLRRTLRFCEALNPLAAPWPPGIETRVVNLGPRIGKVVQYRSGLYPTQAQSKKEPVL